jgi:hypothetical protein
MRRILLIGATIAILSVSGVGTTVASHLRVFSSDIVNGAIQAIDLSATLRGQLNWAVVPRGQTIRGAIGADFDASAATLPSDWGVVGSLPSRARNYLTDNDVYVNVAGWQGSAGQVRPVLDPDEVATSASCTGTRSNPTAPAGKVCIYVTGGDNATAVNGYSIVPGTGGNPYGFKLAWTSANAGDTFIDAVWAYRAP